MELRKESGVMYMRKRLFITTLFSFACMVYGQEMAVTMQDEQQQAVTDRAAESGDEQGMAFAEKEVYVKHPLLLNKASRQDLSASGFFTPLQIDQLLLYIRWMGPLLDKYELQAIPGWDLQLIRSILPYVALENEWNSLLTLPKGTTKLQHTLLMRVGSNDVFSNETKEQAFTGDANHALLRYRVQWGSVSAGCTLAKDAGEKWWGGGRIPVLDFQSFYFAIQGKNKLRRLVLGDYTVQLGQGLVQWQQLSFGKSGDLISMKRQGPVIQPYRSSGAFYFYRGVALTLTHHRFHYTLFASGRSFDANRVSDTANGQAPVITSVISSGYHRTAAEIRDRDRLRVFSGGGQWKYESANGHIALNGVFHQFSQALLPSAAPHAHYSFRGRSFGNISIDHSLTYRNIHWFGEWATNEFRYHAVTMGCLLSIHPQVDIGFLIRDWSPGYQSFFSNGFGESSKVTNERGVFTCMVLRLSRSLRMEGYIDLYAFPWLRFQQTEPVYGNEQCIRLRSQLGRDAYLYIQYRYGTENPVLALPFAFAPTACTQQYRFHAEGKVQRLWTIRVRTEIVTNRNVVEHTQSGFLSYIEAGKKIKNKSFAFAARAQYFSTDGYPTRIFAYEHDVLYAGRTRFFYGQGIRWCVNVDFPVAHLGQPSRPVTLHCWLRLSSTKYITNNYLSYSYSNSSHGASLMEANTQLLISF